MTTTSRVPQPPPPTPADDDPTMMTWIDHLKELRDRLLKICLAVLVGLVIGFAAVLYNDYALIDYIRRAHIPAAVDLQSVRPGEVFTTGMKVAFGIGISLAMPVIVYQILAYVVPGLTERERRIIFFVLPFIVICFVGGLTFGWFVTVPAAFDFLLGQGAGRFEIQPTIESFLSLFTRLMLLNGVLFEMPVLVYSLIWLGVVERRTLAKYRRYAVLIIVIVAAMVTPTTDPVNLGLVAVPMYLLYELGLVLAFLAPRRKARS